jgi:uncharacterized protein YqjF (DUF2071 family)
MDRDFNGGILTETAHRPWPMPEMPWVMTQTWHDLLFAHWPVDARELAKIVPATLPLDLFERVAWVGVVPFRMTNVAPRGVPSMPWISEFPELNVRTYVRIGGRPGVYFFSLDASAAIPVLAARTLLNLPYYSAVMAVSSAGAAIEYRSRRTGTRGAELSAIYGPEGPSFAPREGSLEYFLTERYCLYNLNRRGRPYRLEIHHPPWPLHAAHAQFMTNTMGEVNGIVLPDRQPLLHFARRQDMVAWAPTRL